MLFRIAWFVLVLCIVWHVTLSPGAKRLDTANGRSSDVSVIDPEVREVVKTIGVGHSPWDLVVAS